MESLRIPSDPEKMLNPPAASIYEVECTCGWFGMSDECQHRKCPNCGDRVSRKRVIVMPSEEGNGILPTIENVKELYK